MCRGMYGTQRMSYSGKDRLDITVKSGKGIGKVFAPTWEMVRGVKQTAWANKLYTTIPAPRYNVSRVLAQQAEIVERCI